MDDLHKGDMFFGACRGRLTRIDIKVGILAEFPDDEISPAARVWLTEIREILADHQADEAEYYKWLNARRGRILKPAIAAE